MSPLRDVAVSIFRAPSVRHDARPARSRADASQPSDRKATAVRVASTFCGVALASLFLAGACAARAADAAIEAQLTWYGVYQVSHDAVVADKGSYTGTRIVSTGPLPPASNSDRVPGQPEVRFGFGFTLSGPRVGEVVELRFVRRYPPQGVVDPRTGERVLREESGLRLAVGQSDHFVGYIFNRPEEIVPGVWTFELWHKDAPLLSKSFTVYEP
jgi:hypothetical protein